MEPLIDDIIDDVFAGRWISTADPPPMFPTITLCDNTQ